MATAILHSAAEQTYHLPRPSSRVAQPEPSPSNLSDNRGKPVTEQEKTTFTPLSTQENSATERKNPVEEVKQRQTELIEEQQKRKEELEAAKKAREEREARAEAARKEREAELEAKHLFQQEKMEKISELQRKVDLGLYDVIQADRIAKEYQAISEPFTLGNISTPNIGIDTTVSVDLYA